MFMIHFPLCHFKNHNLAGTARGTDGSCGEVTFVYSSSYGQVVLLPGLEGGKGPSDALVIS